MPILPSRPVVVSMLNNKGALYIENQEYGKAKKSLSKALKMAEKSEQQRSKDVPPAVDSSIRACPCDNVPSHQETVTEHSEPELSQIPSSLVEESSASETSVTNKTPLKHRAEYDEGMDYFKAPLRLNDRSRCIDGTILFNLGRGEHNQGNFNEAMALYKRSLKSAEIHDEPLTLATLFSVGQIHYIRGEHTDALAAYRKSLSLANTAFGADSLEVAACMNCIGVLHYIMQDGDSDVALDTLQQALLIRQSKQGLSHIDVGTTWNNIGRIYFQQAAYDDAMKAYQSSLRIRKAVQGASVDVAATVFNIGQVHHQLGARAEALTYYKEFLKLAKKHFGDYHRDVCIVTTCMGQGTFAERLYTRELRVEWWS
jgi:tetratricopeptide (TPR) repeat protein